MGIPDEKRKEIDLLDEQIAKLLAKRFDLTSYIGSWKKENGLPVRCPEREQQVLEHVQSVSNRRSPEITEIYGKILELSRNEQQPDDVFGLIGHPLGHSYSQPIHAAFGFRYSLWDVTEEQALAFLREKTFSGINVTIPYKKLAYSAVDFLDSTASLCGSVNTVCIRNGFSYGYNTDYYGFNALLDYYHVDLAGKKVAVLGKGGTAGTCHAVACGRGATVSLIGRNEEPDFTSTQILINATPVGMFPDDSGCLFPVERFSCLEGVVDVVYHPLRTRLVYDAQKNGIPAYNGLFMLVAQAKESHRLFGGHSQKPVNEVYKEILWDKINIVLVGMPSAGKSLIGQYLAASCKKKFVDSDGEILTTTGMASIPALFERYGETYFRDTEQEVLKRLSRQSGLVIATGGGSVLRKENRYNLASNGLVIYIKRNVSLLETEGRPLSKDKETLLKMEEERTPLYEEIADITVENNDDIQKCIREIMQKVEAYYAD